MEDKLRELGQWAGLEEGDVLCIRRMIDETLDELVEGRDKTADFLEAIAWWARNKKVAI